MLDQFRAVEDEFRKLTADVSGLRSDKRAIESLQAELERYQSLPVPCGYQFRAGISSLYPVPCVYPSLLCFRLAALVSGQDGKNAQLHEMLMSHLAGLRAHLEALIEEKYKTVEARADEAKSEASLSAQRLVGSSIGNSFFFHQYFFSGAG